MHAPAPRRDVTTPSAPADPPPDAVARFAGAYRELARGAPDAPLIAAVSGGPDSLALLLLAHAALGSRMSAITVDHGLRPEAAAEARHVAAICARRGIGHTIERVDPPAAPVGNLQSWARTVRYDILDLAAIPRRAFVATGHHADDQRETMLMRLNRGSGVAGLAGIRSHFQHVVRPLLGWRRAELAAIVAGCGEIAIVDPSNDDVRFDRTRIRRSLTGADWLDPVAVARSAAALGEADDAVEWAVDEAWSRCVTINVGSDSRRVVLDPGAGRGELLPREIERRLVLRALKRVDASCAPRESLLARTLLALRHGVAITVGHVLARPIGDSWVFEPATPARPVRVMAGD